MEQKSSDKGYYISTGESRKSNERRKREKRKKILFIAIFITAAIITISLTLFVIFGGILSGEDKIYGVNEVKINPMMFEGRITLRGVVTDIYKDIAREDDFAISDRDEIIEKINGEKYSVFVKYTGNTAMPLYGEDIVITGEFHKNESDGKPIFIADSYEYKGDLSGMLGDW